MKLKQISLAAISLLTAGTMLADGPFRNHRYDSFKATPTKQGQTVFAGNSITNMHEWWEAFGDVHSIIGRGNSGGFSYELLDNLESYIDSKPEKFFLMIGTNDLNTSETVDATFRRICAIIKRVQLESPSTKIYLQTILPRANYANSKWEACNALLREKYGNDGDVTLIDLTEPMMGMATENVWSLDKLHPQPKGYATWTHCIEEYVGHQSIYPAGADITADMQRTNGKGASFDMRPAQFAFYKVEPTDVLIFGDDHIHGGEWHELMGSAAFKDRGSGWGTGGYNLTQAKTIVNIALRDQENKPAKIVINYGEGGKDLTNYRLIVDEAKNLAPDAQIYIMNLPPRVNANNDTETTNFNASLQTIATEKGATYVDIYTPLAADRALNMMANNHLSGRGYVVVANNLAEAMNDITTDPVSLTEYEQVYNRRTIRSIIGNALTGAFTIDYGSKPGQIKESHRAAIEAAASEAAAIINNTDLTEAQANAAAAKVNAAIADARADLNLPMASTENNDYWYVLTSARGNKTLASSDGKLIGESAPGASTLGWNIWQFIDRGDQTFDIRNANGEYVNPTANHDTQMTVTTTRPDRGFTLGASTHTTGNYIIHTTNSQLNQTSNGAVYNWYGSSCPNTGDQGCSYSITLFEGTVIDPEEAPIQSGWYEITRASDNMRITNLPTSARQNATHSYAMQYISKEQATPAEWIYIDVDGDTRHVRPLNGFFVSDFTSNSRTASNIVMSSSTSVGGAFNVQYWTHFTINGVNNVVGRSSGKNDPHFFRHVSDAELANYDIWTVRIAANTASEPFNDTHVTLNSDGNRGIATVYNNGTLFLAPGTTFTAADLTITAPTGVEQDNANPQVEIDTNAKEIRIIFTGEIVAPETPATETLASGWYVMNLQSAQSAASNRATLVQQMNEAITAGKTTMFATETEYEQTQSGVKFYYHAGIGDASTLASPALTFFYVEHPEMAKVNIQSQNGHHVKPNGCSSRTATDITLSDLTTYNNANLPLSIWLNNNAGCPHDLAGTFSDVSSTWNFAPAALDGYDLYKVNIIGETSADITRDDVKVSLVSDANKGLQSVYNGGTFFVTKGTPVTTADITVPAHANNDNPLITIADGDITVDYTQTPSAITEVNTSKEETEQAYDLWGRRARTPRHGIYIVNGKKIRL